MTERAHSRRAMSYNKYFINTNVINDVGPGVVITASVCRVNKLAIKYLELRQRSAGFLAFILTMCTLVLYELDQIS